MVLRPEKTCKSKQVDTRKTRLLLSVVVATKNRAKMLPELIRALARQRAGAFRFEVLITDNGSRDDTGAQVYRLRRLYPALPIRYLFLPTANASWARNEGAWQAKGKYLAFLDDDCQPSQDWVHRAIKSFDRTGVKAVGGPALVPKSKEYPEWFQGEWEDLKHRVRIGPLDKNQYLFEGNFLIRRSDYLALGGMKMEMGPSEHRFAFHEGTELQNRMRARWRGTRTIFYDCHLAVKHQIQPDKVRLKSRFKRMLLAGVDHPKAHLSDNRIMSSWRLPILFIRAYWRTVRILGSFFAGWGMGGAHWRTHVYTRTSREIYRLGETLGEIVLILKIGRSNSSEHGSKTTLRSRLRKPFLTLWRGYLRKNNGWGHIPLGIAASTPEYLRSSVLDAGKMCWQRKGEVNLTRASYGSGTQHHPLMMQECKFRQPNVWLARLPAATVFGPSIGVADKNRVFLSDVSIEWSKKPEDHGIMRKFFVPKPRELKGCSILLASTGGNTFHHWIIDVLPRLAVLENKYLPAPTYYLVNGFSEKFQTESLRLCGVPLASCVPLDHLVSYRCEELLLPSLPCASGHPSKAVCSFLRQKILSTQRRSEARIGRKILIGRSDATSRQAPQWEFVRHALLREGFEEVLPSRLSLVEQAKVFYEADWIVGLHGAALTNLVFCRFGTKVVEIFGWKYVNPCYRDLCSVVGVDHFGVVVRGPKDKPDIVFELHDASGEIHVEPEQVLKALEEAGFWRKTDIRKQKRVVRVSSR